MVNLRQQGVDRFTQRQAAQEKLFQFLAEAHGSNCMHVTQRLLLAKDALETMHATLANYQVSERLEKFLPRYGRFEAIQLYAAQEKTLVDEVRKMGSSMIGFTARLEALDGTDLEKVKQLIRTYTKTLCHCSALVLQHMSLVIDLGPRFAYNAGIVCLKDLDNVTAETKGKLLEDIELFHKLILYTAEWHEGTYLESHFKDLATQFLQLCSDLQEWRTFVSNKVMRCLEESFFTWVDLRTDSDSGKNLLKLSDIDVNPSSSLAVPTISSESRRSLTVLALEVTQLVGNAKPWQNSLRKEISKNSTTNAKKVASKTSTKSSLPPTASEDASKAKRSSSDDGIRAGNKTDSDLQRIKVKPKKRQSNARPSRKNSADTNSTQPRKLSGNSTRSRGHSSSDVVSSPTPSNQRAKMKSSGSALLTSTPINANGTPDVTPITTLPPPSAGVSKHAVPSLKSNSSSSSQSVSSKPKLSRGQSKPDDINKQKTGTSSKSKMSRFNSFDVGKILKSPRKSEGVDSSSSGKGLQENRDSEKAKYSEKKDMDNQASSGIHRFSNATMKKSYSTDDKAAGKNDAQTEQNKARQWHPAKGVTAASLQRIGLAPERLSSRWRNHRQAHPNMREVKIDSPELRTKGPLDPALIAIRQELFHLSTLARKLERDVQSSLMQIGDPQNEVARVDLLSWNDKLLDQHRRFVLFSESVINDVMENAAKNTISLRNSGSVSQEFIETMKRPILKGIDNAKFLFTLVPQSLNIKLEERLIILQYLEIMKLEAMKDGIARSDWDQVNKIRTLLLSNCHLLEKLLKEFMDNTKSNPFFKENISNSLKDFVNALDVFPGVKNQLKWSEYAEDLVFRLNIVFEKTKVGTLFSIDQLLQKATIFATVCEMGLLFCLKEAATILLETAKLMYYELRDEQGKRKLEEYGNFSECMDWCSSRLNRWIKECGFHAESCSETSYKPNFKNSVPPNEMATCMERMRAVLLNPTQLNPEMKSSVSEREPVIRELVKKERDYVLLLAHFHENYVKRARLDNALDNITLEEIFQPAIIYALLMSHSHILSVLSEKMLTWSDTQTVGDVLTTVANFKGFYTDWVNASGNGRITYRKELEKNPRFKKWATMVEEIPIEGAVGTETLDARISSMLILPVQRVLKYPLLIKALQKATTKDHPDYPLLQLALIRIEELCTVIDGANH